MSKLASADDAQAIRGVNYLARHASEPAVMDHARRLMRDGDDRTFDRVVLALSTAGIWGPGVPEGWLRYLVSRLDSADAKQRAAIIVELGKIAWLKQPGGDDPRLLAAVQKLIKDSDASVRLNALSAAACLKGESRLRIIESAAQDAEPSVARHATLMRQLLTNTIPPEDSPALPAEASSTLRQLAKLEIMPAKSADIAIEADSPPMIRLQAVRVSRSSQPADLMSVFDAKESTLRDLACLAALQRFTTEQCRELAKDLIASFSAQQRMAGAILGGMVEKDAQLMELLQYRADQNDDWILQQHYRLGLAMQGHAAAGFDPAGLLAKDKMPRTTVILALLHLGRLEGVDWLLNPFGSPPVDLRLVLDTARFAHVLTRYLPAPSIGFWAEGKVQQMQIDRLRDWYLIHRPDLTFDAKSRRFILQERS
jgi:hypothetical protein